MAASERSPILRAYLKEARGGRPHFDVNADSSNEELTRTAPLCHVFEFDLEDDERRRRLASVILRSAKPCLPFLSPSGSLSFFDLQSLPLACARKKTAGLR